MKTNAVHMLAAIVGVSVGVGFAAEEPVEVRVRQCPAGPQIQVDGVSVPPRFFWGRTGLPPQTLKREWRRFELSLTPDHDIKRASLHFRFDETNGTTQVRNLQLKGDMAPKLPPLENFNIWPPDAAFRPTVEDGAFTLRLRPYEGTVKDPDFHCYSPDLAFPKGKAYVFSFEARGEGCEWLNMQLFEIAASGAHTPVALGRVEDDTLLVTTRLAADAGVNLVSFHAPNSWRAGGDDYEALDATCDHLIAANPHVLFVPRVIVDAPDWWIAAHPAARIQFADGTRGKYASVSDREYRLAAEGHMGRLCRHLMARYPRNFAGVHPGAQQSSENMYHGSWRRKVAGDVDMLQNAMADFIAGLAHVARRATDGRKLVIFFYGYAYECSTNPFGPGNSGHYAMQRLLDRAKGDIDILCSPISYWLRSQTGAVAPMACAETVMRAGVLWLCEDDSRTFLDLRRSTRVTEGPKYGIAGTKAMLRHNLEMMTLKGYGSWWMDLPGRGWFASREIWDVMREHLPADRAALCRPAPFRPDIASILDEASLMSLTNNPSAITRRLVKESRDVFARTGRTWGQYLLTDVARGGVRVPFKFFQAAWKLDDEKVAGLLADRKANPEETRIWFYAPGLYDGEGREDLARMTGLTGFVFRRCPAAARERGLFTVERKPDDLVWQTYRDGSPSVLVRKAGKGYDVFVGCPDVSLPLTMRIFGELVPGAGRSLGGE